MIDITLQNEGFGEPLYVEGREAVTNLFQKGERCGIYVLHFADGMAYVGKSVDVTRRYVEHRRDHADIQRISFKAVKEGDLDRAEWETRELLQGKGFVLRGVVGVVQLAGRADFDLVMSPEEQERWLSDLTYVDYSGSRMVNPALRRTYTGRFQRLGNKPFFPDVVDVLKQYARIGIPKTRASEDSFWSCSCLPKSHVYARININWQEVLSAFEQDGEIIFSFHFARSQLENGELFAEYFDHTGPIPFYLTGDETGYEADFDLTDPELLNEARDLYDLEPPEELQDTLASFFEDYPGMVIANHSYKPGGKDQINFMVRGKEQALNLLHEKDVISAIRHFNLRLMRLGPSPYKSSHCLDLADLLVYEG
jgi:hypothetical protein